MISHHLPFNAPRPIWAQRHGLCHQGNDRWTWISRAWLTERSLETAGQRISITESCWCCCSTRYRPDACRNKVKSPPCRRAVYAGGQEHGRNTQWSTVAATQTFNTQARADLNPALDDLRKSIPVNAGQTQRARSCNCKNEEYEKVQRWCLKFIIVRFNNCEWSTLKTGVKKVKDHRKQHGGQQPNHGRTSRNAQDQKHRSDDLCVGSQIGPEDVIKRQEWEILVNDERGESSWILQFLKTVVNHEHSCWNTQNEQTQVRGKWCRCFFTHDFWFGKNLTILHLFKAWPHGAKTDENCRWVALVKPSLVLTSSTCLIWMKREKLNRSNQSNCKSAIGKSTVDQTNPRFSKYETSRGDRRCRQLVAKHQNENKTLYGSRETTIRLATSINQHTAKRLSKRKLKLWKNTSCNGYPRNIFYWPIPMADGKSFTKNESSQRLSLNIQQVEASPSQGVSNATYIRVDRSWHQSIGRLVVRTHRTPDWCEAASGRISVVWWISTGSAQQCFWSLKLLIHSLRVTCLVTVERLYGDDKKKALSNFYDHFCEEIDQLFFKKFQELSDLNIGEGETTRIVGRLLNAKTNVVDQIRGWRDKLVLTILRFKALSLMVIHQ